MGSSEESGASDIESRLDQLEQRIQRHENRAEDGGDSPTPDGSTTQDGDGLDPGATRRGVLTAGGVLAALGLGAGTASADPRGRVGTATDPLETLYTEALNGGVTGGTELTSLVGSGLADDGSGNLQVSSGGIGTAELNTPFTDLATLFGTPVTAGGNLDLGGNTLTNTASINGSVTGNTEITDLVGSGLSISSGSLEATTSALWEDAGDDGLLNPVDSGDNGIGVTNVQTDTLTDNGSGDVTMGNSLDMGGNNIRLTEDYELDMQPGLDTVEFLDTNNSHTTLRIGTGDPGVVSLMNANLRVRNSNSITDNFGDAFLTINSGGPLGVNKTLDLNGNNVETSTGGLTVTTNNNGNLALNPGSGNNLVFNNTASQDDSLLTIDSSGNVGVGSKSIADIGSGSSKWTDGSSGSSWLEPSDSGDTKLEGIDTITSNDQDSALTITQNSNSSDATPEDLTIETRDSSANNAVGNIVLDADSGNASPADIVFNTSATERARVNGNGLNVDTLTDNGSGDVTMGNSLDMGGNNIRLTEDYELDMQPGLDAVEFRDTNNGHTTFRTITGNPGAVDLLNANLRIRNGYGITDEFGETHLTINGAGPLGVNKTLDLNSNDINNVTSIGGGGSAIGVDDSLDLNGNDLTDSTGDLTLGSTLDANGNRLTDSTGALYLPTRLNLELDPIIEWDGIELEFFNLATGLRVWFNDVGDVNASGVKNFVETVETEAGRRTVTYTSVEAPEARTETSGIATVEDGVAVVDLDDHFAWVTDGNEPLIAQVTAHSDDPVTLRVTERSTDQIRIESDGAGPDTFEVSYTIKGIRQGYADKTVVSDPDDGTRMPSGDDDVEPMSSIAETNRLDSTTADEPTTADQTAGRRETDRQNSESRQTGDANGSVSNRVEHLEAENERLRERNAELESRLAAVEAELGIDPSAGQQGMADD